ncbi:hypothetical protein D187_009857 [Cystobacter fuscus DSM 2262]|uniref:Uncharacterized protein n=1 Tax=Cystobacter fuscus (strain ATCC 25194 / DSM 2262 / NBRC 100088 / M29) TaxID=1242864 RepID=S9QKY6_CYSF2|nr:hypothetical protein D187_009857 [Cystobacter fuscus DSM 2262]
MGRYIRSRTVAAPDGAQQVRLQEASQELRRDTHCAIADELLPALFRQV